MLRPNDLRNIEIENINFGELEAQIDDGIKRFRTVDNNL